MILCGRGWGKNWTGSNWVNECAESGDDSHIALVGRDAHDVRAYMVEGESGILEQARPDFLPTYNPSKRLLTWPNGCKGHIYYAEEPKTIRGPNHSKGWCDEIASWQDAHLGDTEDTAWSNLLMTMRKGDPQILVTGTPRPVKLIKQVLKYRDVRIVRGHTNDNRANLSPKFYQKVVEKYKGTRLGRQELAGEILDDAPGALVNRAWIENARVKEPPRYFDRIVIGVDPQAAGVLEEGDSVGLSKVGAETGIIVSGKRGSEFYHIADRTVRASPGEWALAVLQAYYFFRADAIVVERNNGGAMVEHTLRTVNHPGISGENANIITVWASKGKQTRAEPIAALYEQGRIHHIGQDFDDLEDQWCSWEPVGPDGSLMPSPDRLDASVWSITELADLDQEASSSSEDEYTSFWQHYHQDAPGIN